MALNNMELLSLTVYLVHKTQHTSTEETVEAERDALEMKTLLDKISLLECGERVLG